MNLFKNTLIALIPFIIFVGCRKNYSCVCNNVASHKGFNGNGAGVYPIYAFKKSKAQTKCSEMSSYIPNTNPKEYDVYCELN